MKWVYVGERNGSKGDGRRMGRYIERKRRKGMEREDVGRKREVDENVIERNEKWE